ncbi:hypothetical protein [Chitinophaga rhizophila]|uniref:PAS domain-containing protein n=1 Tax=Chitinophaga rhizophila TaxID=2866212 RepID=A0ABS7G5U2_9BACT|nr:hypothetical protein [Chitinophaga rhizophila]MBW8682989.1 hypothetical protein [Chitinophaga rhizophila]
MSRLLTYNPFEPLDLPFIEMLVQRRYYYLILQVFRYPGVHENKGFMATAYQTLPEAQVHLAELQQGEGKMLQLDHPEHRDRLLPLLDPSSGYQFFYGTTPDAIAGKTLSQVYKQKVNGYIKSQLNMKNAGGFEVTLKMIHGRFMAVITSGEQRREVLFYEMIK